MLLSRLVYAVLSLLAVSVLVFAATQALPGNAAVARLGVAASPQAVAAFEQQFHLDDPIMAQYLRWLAGLLHGQLGVSFSTGMSVESMISDQVVNSLVLLIATALIGMPLAVAIGAFTAVRMNRGFDHTSSVVMLVISALPEFVVGIGLVALLATQVFALLPAVSPLNPNLSVFSQWDLLVLPTLTLIVISVPYVALTVRACMAEVLASDYVTMARLKGMLESRVILRHALPNIAGPTFQVIAQSLAYLAGGIIVVEAVFQYPGVGLAFFSAVASRDIPVVQALGVLLAAFYIVVNLAADIGTELMTPTMRAGAR